MTLTDTLTRPFRGQTLTRPENPHAPTARERGKTLTETLTTLTRLDPHAWGGLYRDPHARSDGRNEPRQPHSETPR